MPDRWRAALHGLLGRVADASVVLSFDRSGFVRHSATFRADDLDVDLSGRICLVSGANSGLGLATSRALAARGATTWLLCRHRGRGEEARDLLRRETGNARVELALTDLASLASVRDLCARLVAPRVDLLVHNAGVLPDELTLTDDGLELTWATNVVGPFLLTSLLRPALERSADARVVFVSSGGMYLQRLTLDDLRWERRRFDGVIAYANSKRAQVILAELWARRLAGTTITVSAMHPGWADTPAVRDSLPRFHALLRRRLRSAAEGADTILWLGVCPRLQGDTGRFWFDRQPQETTPIPGTRESAAERDRLWELCRAQAGVPDEDAP
jgi:dehydrogenase/reductase SDR family member 12